MSGWASGNFGGLVPGVGIYGCFEVKENKILDYEILKKK